MNRPAVQRAPPPRFSSNVLLAIAAAALAIALAWILWPSPLSRVKNLGSRGTNIIAFGDSLTAGYGAAPAEAYPVQLSSLIHHEVRNAGVSGDTTDSALVRLDADVLSADPRIVIIGLGGNDFLRSTELKTTEANLRQIVRKVQQAGAMVVILGFRFPSITANYGAMYERVAKEEHCLLIPDLLDGILSDPSLKSDEIHPNGRGYTLMAERISRPLVKLIRKADSRR